MNQVVEFIVMVDPNELITNFHLQLQEKLILDRGTSQIWQKDACEPASSVYDLHFRFACSYSRNSQVLNTELFEFCRPLKQYVGG